MRIEPRGILKKFLKFLAIFILLIILVYFLFFRHKYPLHVITHSFKVGDSLDSFNGVTVYNNGTEYSKSHGRHYSADSFYYGKKWQCVEYIKRYYHDHLEHKFPDGSGHAKDFFDAALAHGEMNKRRGLIQYRNGDREKPAVNDILVFGGKYGHVAVVCRVEDELIEVIQQNIYMTPKEIFTLRNENGRFFVGDREPLGWLRKR